MNWSEITFDAPRRTLRQFAWLSLFVFGGIAARKFYLGLTTAGTILTLVAVAIGITGIVWPRAIRHIYGAAMIAVFPIGFVVSQLLLAMVFFGMFLPVALVFKVIGRDALQRRKLPGSETYWEVKPEAANASRYFQQF